MKSVAYVNRITSMPGNLVFHRQVIGNLVYETFEVFLNPFAKSLAKILSIPVCDGIVIL